MGYYTRKLAGERLKRCYDIAPTDVRGYLDAEIEFVQSRIAASDFVLELGCGYGRVLAKLAGQSRMLVGIDTSVESIRMARTCLHGLDCKLAVMDAARLAFLDSVFDVTFCIQNGISALAVEPIVLVRGALRATRAGGLVLFSSYTENFWPHRLRWFEMQAAEGLVGEIDYDATGDGTIVCKDGFRATTFSPDAFRKLASSVGIEPRISVESGAVFCELPVRRY
jgi:2-polyprenyl-6-hydroxyphenyl methylase/3-demethylubiquinone-9 3-methyltransferase